ncbi:MAG: LPS export ABC transporter permease LptG [Nitrospirales bacterium]
MTILTRYILRSVTQGFLICLTGLMTVYLVVDFFEQIRRFMRHDAAGSDVFWYFLFKIPGIVVQLAPVAVLMATLLSLGLLLRHNEITAMRGSGLSLFRLAVPYVGFAGLVSLGLLVLSAVVVPLATARAELIKEVYIKKQNPGVSLKAERIWIQAGPNMLVKVDAVDPGGVTLRGITLYQLGPTFELLLVTDAEEAHYTPDGWILRRGVERRLFPGGKVMAEQFLTKPVGLLQIPEDFESWLSMESQEMTLGSLKAYANRLQRNGYNVSRFLTDYHGRWAFPFVCLVMAVVGMALSLRRTGVRGGGLAIGIGQALGISFLYWTTHSVAIALGRGGVLIPVAAGWVANLLFISFGLYLLLRVRY